MSWMQKCPEAERLSHIKIGSAPALIRKGNTTMNMNASYEILKFFNEFQLPKASKAEIRIYNVSGQEIKTFIFQKLSAGAHEIAWDGTNIDGEYVSGGLYLISLSTSDIHKTKKAIFIR